MTKREKAARACISTASAVYGAEQFGVHVVCAGLLAALRACESERRRFAPYPGLRQRAATALTIRDRILDAMERSNGGTL